MGNRLKEFDREARKSRSDRTNFILCFVQRAQSNFYAFVIIFYQLMLAYRLMEKSIGDDLVCNCTVFKQKVSLRESNEMSKPLSHSRFRTFNL